MRAAILQSPGLPGTYVIESVQAHEQMEDQHLYGPVAREAAGRDAALAEWEQHHQKEVREAEALMRRIDGANPSDQGWLAQVRELKSALEHHIQEEEGKIWPKIRQVWDAWKLERPASRWRR